MLEMKWYVVVGCVCVCIRDVVVVDERQMEGLTPAEGCAKSVARCRCGLLE